MCTERYWRDAQKICSTRQLIPYLARKGKIPHRNSHYIITCTNNVHRPKRTQKNPYGTTYILKHMHWIILTQYICNVRYTAEFTWWRLKIEHYASIRVIFCRKQLNISQKNDSRAVEVGITRCHYIIIRDIMAEFTYLELFVLRAFQCTYPHFV